MAAGMDLVIFPTILSKHGVDAAHIGIAFTIDVSGGILMSFFLSRFIAKFGMMPSLKFAAIGYATSILLIYFYQNFYLWITFAFFMGACWFIYAITRQSWLNILVEGINRGVALGIFSMIISFGVSMGPIIVSLSGADNYFSFIISATLVVASLLCLMPLKQNIQPTHEAERISLFYFFKKNPRCFLGRFFLDFQTYLLLTFTVIFGINLGLSYEAAGVLITAYMSSGLADLWVGFLLKKFSPYKIMNIGYLGCMYCFLTIILYHQSYWFLFFLYFLFGIFVACIFVAVFKIANDDYPKEKLVAANATFQLIGSIGSLFGTFTGGYLVNIFGANGFPITIVLSCTAYLSFLIFYEKKFSEK